MRYGSGMLPPAACCRRRRETVTLKKSLQSDGRTLLTATRGIARLWRTDTAEPQGIEFRTAWFLSVAFSPDGQSPALGQASALKVWLYQTATGRPSPRRWNTGAVQLLTDLQSRRACRHEQQ